VAEAKPAGAAEICVIFNPSAGRGRAPQRLESLRRTLGSRATFQPTEAPGHAEELAFEAAKDGFPVIGAAGGDGTVHEVANGLLRAARPDISLAIYPIGSANDYAYALRARPEWWLEQNAQPGPRTVDVGSMQVPGGRQRYFVNGIGIGFNGSVTIESRRIKFLQGNFLYTLALLRAMWSRYDMPLITATLDDTKRQVRTLAFSIALGRREGNFILAPNAELDDGLFDYLQAGPIGRWELLRYVPGMITGNLPVGHPLLWIGRCRQVSLSSEAPLPIHLDGEVFSRPEDGVRELEVRMLPGALRVLPNTLAMAATP
jgi:diacylglycerol kinase (ATP)